MTETSPDDHSASSPPKTRPLLLLAGTLVAVPALLPLVVGFLPRLYFETDPRVSAPPAALTMFGPSGAAVLHVISVACAVLALAIYVSLGGRLRTWVIALAGLGIAAAFWQGLRHAENLLPMSSWIAGGCLAVGAAHIGRFAFARRWMAALLIAMMVPVGLQAGFDVLVQKPRDIAWWQANEADILALRGIEPGSAHHQLLERRAMSNDATGPFGFSNALGTLAAGGAALALCVGLGGWLTRRRQTRGAALAALVASGCGVGAVWFTHSAGALGSLAIAISVAAIAWYVPRKRFGRVPTLLALCAVALPIVVILVRGGIGPPDSMEGERSLLFRFHYWQAAVRVWGDGLPSSAVLGVGPHAFTQGYFLHKNPINPENVASTHNVFVDWVVMLGLGGVAWCVLVLGWLGGAARSMRTPGTGFAESSTADCNTNDAKPEGPILRRPHVIAALLSACVLFGTQYAVQSAMMDAELAVLWLVGLIGFVVVASAIATRDDLPPGAMRAGLLGMSIAVLVHSQIEMAFALMATAGPAWFLVGLAGSGDGLASDARPRAGRGVASTLACGCVLSALVVAVFTSPVVRHQAQLAKASDYLYHGKPNHALAALEAAHTILPTDPTATRWIVTLRRDEMVSRAAMGDVAGARRAFALALQPIDAQLASTTPSASASRQRIGLLREASEAIGDPALLDEAIDLLHELAQRAPHGLSDAVLLGDLYWQRGDYTQAAAAYNRALDIDERLYLDPAMRLEAAERSRLVARLNEAASSTLQ